MKKDKFSIKFKQKIVNGTAKVFFNESPVRIICWDRDCEYPIVGLMKSNSNLPETIVIIKNDGTMAVPGMGLVHKDGLYVHHAELPSSGKYDFTKMKPFTPVLVRNEDNNTWFPHFFESYHPQNVGPFRVMGTLRDFLQCVPYEGNEYLLNTQAPIPPFYDIRK